MQLLISMTPMMKMLVVTRSWNISSKQCDRMVLQDPKSLEFLACLSCMTSNSLTHRD
nr:probable chromatin-remodeling complex ATPase chain [Ipomoea batatas]GME07877.1 probable chromatin-remodeling complex ATPase chain [Ipomoea batatas]